MITYEIDGKCPIHAPAEPTVDHTYLEQDWYLLELGNIAEAIMSPETPETEAYIKKRVTLPKIRERSIARLILQSKTITEATTEYEDIADHSSTLLNVAFGDSLDIYIAGNLFLEKESKKSLDATTKSEILRRSGRNLLQIAALGDDDKRNEAIPELLKKPAPLVLDSKRRPKEIDFTPRFREYINYLKAKPTDKPRKGCPAIQAIVENPKDGTRQSLIHSFWGRYVDVMLELPNPNKKKAPEFQIIEKLNK